MSEEMHSLLSQARDGKLTPIEFCKALGQLGIHHTQRMLYLRDIFGLPLDQAKKVLLESEGKSVEGWSEEIGNVINELSMNLKDTDDANSS